MVDQRHVVYPFAVLPTPEGDGFEIVFPDLPGATGFVTRLEDVAEEAREVSRLWIDMAIEDGDDLPEPNYEWDPIDRSPGRFGKVEALLKVSDVAERLGVSERRVHQLADARGVGIVVGGVRLFNPGDVERLKPGPVGRPKTKATT